MRHLTYFNVPSVTLDFLVVQFNLNVIQTVLNSILIKFIIITLGEKEPTNLLSIKKYITIIFLWHWSSHFEQK